MMDCMWPKTVLKRGGLIPEQDQFLVEDKCSESLEEIYKRGMKVIISQKGKAESFFLHILVLNPLSPVRNVYPRPSVTDQALGPKSFIIGHILPELDKEPRIQVKVSY